MLRIFKASGVLAIYLVVATLPGCSGFGPGNATLPGNTPGRQPQASLRVVGTIGTPFSAVVSDQNASWKVQGVIPLNIVIIHSSNTTPTRIVAVKLASGSSLLSVEVINGFNVKLLSSTNNPFGVAVGTINGQLEAFAPPASPDVRFFIKGPSTAIFTALVEDATTGNALQSRAPTLVLFENPNGGSASGHLDGTFQESGNNGPLNVDLILNGATVAHGVGITTTLKFH
jgi:hypothetical protein